MRNHITTSNGTFTVTGCRPRAGSLTHFDPTVTLAAEEGWLSFTASMTVDEARRLADALEARADEAEGR